ncbi:MAG: hypothetical protein LBK12_07640 [Odoribacteraceae bacterium]|jgi:hypothetical protein|nr:hypothetical protein [Odoribacteraceae bacterium]
MSRNLFTVIVLSAVLAIGTVACRGDREIDAGEHAWNLVLESAAGMPASRAGILLGSARLFAFLPGTPPERLFYGEVLNVSRASNQLKASVREGNWHMLIVAPPAGATLVTPRANTPADQSPMYVYRPVTGASGKSEDAAEIFFAGEPVRITSGQVTSLATRLDRNVAMVEVLVRRASANFNKASNGHRVELLDVPTTISYAGNLLPSKSNPDTLPGGLTARLKLGDSPAGAGLLRSDTVRFIIPAHRGSDFLDARPRDTTTMKMRVRLDLERTGGGRFAKTVEVPVTAKCNKVLRVELNVSDGVAVTTGVLPWNEANIQGKVGDEFAGWLYVKAGSGGSGQSWRDALPTVTAAITRWQALRAGGVTVHGILVAGDPARVYEEGFSVPAQARLFGGWAGVSGTELSATDAMAPYSSAHRDLSRYKAIMKLGTNAAIAMGSQGTVFDGFVVTGSCARIPLTVNDGAWINAVEVRNVSTSAAYALSLSGTGTNVLVADNNKGVLVNTGGTLVNATIANNATASSFNGGLGNSVDWGNGGSVTAKGWIDYCAFSELPTPLGMGNVPINTVNTAWFSSTNVAPGPQFNLTGTPKYAVNTRRSPLPGRGEADMFNRLTSMLRLEQKRDIDGKPRHDGLTDIGCYEAAGAKAGFTLNWNIDRVYMSSKMNSTSEHALVLFENPENVPISWSLAVMGGYNASGKFVPGASLTNAVLTGYTYGSGTGVIPGKFGILSGGVANTTNKEVTRGRLKVTSNLGPYLPDVEFDVYQAPSALNPWTEGYVGSFHRNNETNERYIHVQNSGDWTIRIVSGIDWIKIDGNDKSSFYGVVQEISGGVLNGKGNIKFRVGMKSTLPPGAAPRYGLITIHKNGGLAFFYVRQGEEADYIYRPQDPRKQGARTEVVKFAPYTLQDPQHNENANGRNVGPRGGVFSEFPSQIGYFFHWNKTTAYLLGSAKGGKNTPQDKPVGPWDPNMEVCPNGYRQATLGEWVHSAYWNVNVPSPYGQVNPDGDAAGNYVYGRYADGYYDRASSDPVLPSADMLGITFHKAKKGVLMVNHYNNASVFFPCAGMMKRGGNDNASNTIDEPQHSMNWVTQIKTGNSAHNTHWTTGHVGISCTLINQDHCASVRCVKK